MTFPPYLSPGDRVAIVSPAGKVDSQVVERGAELLRQHGFEVVIGCHACGEDGVFSANDSERAADLQEALDDEFIKAIFFSRGGYGCLRTHMRLDWSSFFRKPKWLIGFSDITVFHAHLARNHVASVHGVMPSTYERDQALTESFRKTIDMLLGGTPGYEVTPHPLNRLGTSRGILTGGNLTILQSLRGTPLDLFPEGRILFIEDIHEYHYHLDRMMQNLKAGGVLGRISGLLVGHFTKMRDGQIPFGKNACEIIREAVEPWEYPVAFGFPAGHELPNDPMLMGGGIALNVSHNAVEVKIDRHSLTA